MAANRSTEALRHYVAAMSERKMLAVLGEIERRLSTGEPVTIAGVARGAQVSRQFIHSHDGLHRAVRAGAGRAATTALRIGASGDNNRSGRSDRSVLAAKIERQQEEIRRLQARVRQLQGERARWLGFQLHEAQRVDEDELARLRVTSSDLATDNAALTRLVADLRRSNEALADELTASRRAHAEDVALLGAHSNVKPLERGL